MSKIGREPIKLSAATVEIKGQKLFISGPIAKFTHILADELTANINNGFLEIALAGDSKSNGALWGLHRALLANKIYGSQKLFEKKINIVGLGYKAQISGKNMVFSLGYSHKINYVLPDNVSVDSDRTGQKLVFKSSDKLALGNACDTIRGFRPPEPYKGTGVIVEGEIIIRKAGKTKSA